jgi:ankyrin repeat protein
MTLYDISQTKNDPYFNAWLGLQLQNYLQLDYLLDEIKEQPDETNKKVSYLFRWCAFQLDLTESVSSPLKPTPFCTFDDFSTLALTVAKADMFSRKNLRIYGQYWSSVIGDCGFYYPAAAKLLIECGCLTPYYNHVEQVECKHPDLSVWMLQQMPKEDQLRFYAKKLDNDSAVNSKLIVELLRKLPDLVQRYELKYGGAKDNKLDPLLNCLSFHHEECFVTLLEIKENYKGNEKNACQLLKLAIEQNWQKVAPWMIETAGQSILNFKFQERTYAEDPQTYHLIDLSVSCDCIQFAVLKRRRNIYERLYAVHSENYFKGDKAKFKSRFAVITGSLQCLKDSLFMKHTDASSSQYKQSAVLAEINKVFQTRDNGPPTTVLEMIQGTSKGETLLSLACKLKNCEIALYLLEQGADFKLESYHALYHAIEHQLTSVIMAILERLTGTEWYHSVNQYLAEIPPRYRGLGIPTNQGIDYVFIHMARIGNIQLLKLAIEKGCPLVSLTTEHLLIIFDGIFQINRFLQMKEGSFLSFVEFLDFMFPSNDEPSTTHTIQHTVDYTSFLHELIRRCEYKRQLIKGIQPIVERCIKLGADINAPDKDGRSVLYYVLSQEHNQIANFLIDQGAELKLHPDDQYNFFTPHILEKHPHQERLNCLKRLILKDPSLKEKINQIRYMVVNTEENTDGSLFEWTVLEWVIVMGKNALPYIHFLIENGADISKIDIDLFLQSLDDQEREELTQRLITRFKLYPTPVDFNQFTDLSYLFNQRDFSDLQLQIKVKGESITWFLHASILAKYSWYFAGRKNFNTRSEINDSIDFTLIDPNMDIGVIKDVFWFLYGGKFPIRPERFEALAKVAHFLQIPSLITYLDRWLSEHPILSDWKEFLNSETPQKLEVDTSTE